QADRHGAALRAPLHRVVQQVGDGALQGGRVPAYGPGLEVDVDGDRLGATTHPGQGPLHHVGQVDLADHQVQRFVAGQLHEVADQLGQLLQLGAYVVEQVGAGVGGQLVPGLGQQVDVGAQTGERRT